MNHFLWNDCLYCICQNVKQAFPHIVASYDKGDFTCWLGILQMADVGLLAVAKQWHV